MAQTRRRLKKSDIAQITQEVESPFYTLGKWGNYDRWQCNFCPWDTLEGEAALMAHYRAHHAPPPTPEPQDAQPVFDRFGNLITPAIGPAEESDYGKN